jgi:hypothetical protein
MSEGFEVPEAPEHSDYPYTIPVSVTVSILAVLIAGATLLGHRAHTEELLFQSKATDKWAYYQAKNMRFHQAQALADLLGVLTVQDKDKAEAQRQKFQKDIEKYQGDKEDINKDAKELEDERDMEGRRADRFDGGEAILEIGLVICSVTLLTKRRIFWFTGMVIGFAGIILTLTGLFLH